MATLTIRNFDDHAKELLKVQAKQNRRSMEAQARQLLIWAISQMSAQEVVPSTADVQINYATDPYDGKGFAAYWVERFAGLGEDMEIPARTEMPRKIDFNAPEFL